MKLLYFITLSIMLYGQDKKNDDLKKLAERVAALEKEVAEKGSAPETKETPKKETEKSVGDIAKNVVIKKDKNKEAGSIDLSNMKLESLEGFDKIPNIKNQKKLYIKLVQNKLTNQEGKLFDPLHGLPIVSLDVQGNKLTTFPDLSFFPDLEQFNGTFNKFSELKPSALKGLKNLTIVNVSQNQIKTIDLDAHKGVNPLKVFKASNNKINDLNENMFAGQNKLTELDLSSNSIGSLPTSVFKDLEKLGSLNLSQNRLNTLVSDSLQGLKSLTNLDLSHNQLQELSKDLFKSTPKLYNINLSYNNIKTLDPSLFNPLITEKNKISYLNISGNPIMKDQDSIQAIMKKLGLKQRSEAEKGIFEQ